MPYWKYPEEYELILVINFVRPIYMKDILNLFKNLTWHYTTSNEEKKIISFMDENALWSSYVNSNETFIDEPIKWVHFYTSE